MIYEELNTNEIARRLHADRENNAFTYEGCQALAEWLENLSEDTGEDIELDVVALRCEWSEYSSFADIQEAYSNHEFESIEDVEQETTVIPVKGGRYLVQEF